MKISAKIKYVFLGRFSPLHKGHQEFIERMIRSFGLSNCLIIVGSTNSKNERTPFSFGLRKRMIRTLFPRVKVLSIPDSTPNITHFDDEGNSKWLNDLKTIETKEKCRFVFLGGSPEDLEILSQEFETKVFMDRHKEGKGINATSVREKLGKGKKSNLVDRKIRDLIKLK